MDKELLTQAIEGLELIDINLYSSSVKRFEPIYDNAYPEGMGQQSKLAIEVELLESVSEEGEEKSQAVQVKISFGVRFVKSIEGSDDRPLAEIEACFVAQYLQNRELTNDAIKVFVNHNGVHNVWPFWREHAFRMSLEAKLPKPKISLFRSTVEE